MRSILWPAALIETWFDTLTAIASDWVPVLAVTAAAAVDVLGAVLAPLRTGLRVNGAADGELHVIKGAMHQLRRDERAVGTLMRWLDGLSGRR